MLLKDLPIGTRVVDNDTKYFGESIVWLIADKNHSGYPANSVTLISEKILCLKCFDAKENNDNIYPGCLWNKAGRNDYKLSNINQWLNSEKYNWFNPTHKGDRPPNSDGVYRRESWKKGHNTYDTEDGFLTNFSTKFKNSLLITTLERERGYYRADTTMTAKIFLASEREVGLRSMFKYDSLLPLFKEDSNDLRIAYPTKPATEKCIYENPEYFTTSLGFSWWLRTAVDSEEGSNVREIRYDGDYVNTSAYEPYCGIRPLCNVTNSIEVSDSPNSKGEYVLTWNKPPSRPNEIIVPDIKAGKYAMIRWGAATDPEGYSISYELERKVDGNSWSRIYSGSNREYNDKIIKGWGSVAYRVKALDSQNAQSDYMTSSTKTVINNADPVISCDLSGDLGVKTGAFDIFYSVNDEDTEQSLTVKEYIGDILKRSYTATRGESYSLQVIEDDWRELLNGEHKIKIVVEDSEGGTAEKVFTFSKNETSILLELKKPLEADDRVTKAIINVGRVIPDGADMRIEVCNNAFDDNPMWQDVTNAVLRNAKIFIANETKTADKWGVNIRIAVDRNNATGDCYISSIGGVFE